MKRLEEIYDILNTFIDPKCELIYRNNFELLISVILSAQTTDKKVNVVTKDMFLKYPTPNALKSASYEEIYEIIKPLGLARSKTKNIIETSKMIDEVYNGVIPSSYEELMSLPGVGRKTSNVVRALGFNIPSIAVDTHVKRVSIRLGLAKDDSKEFEVEESLKKEIDEIYWINLHHLLLLFGRYYCKSINPVCQNCKVKTYCKFNKQTS